MGERFRTIVLICFICCKREDLQASSKHCPGTISEKYFGEFILPIPRTINCHPTSTHSLACKWGLSTYTGSTCKAALGYDSSISSPPSLSPWVPSIPNPLGSFTSLFCRPLDILLLPRIHSAQHLPTGEILVKAFMICQHPFLYPPPTAPLPLNPQERRFVI